MNKVKCPTCGKEVQESQRAKDTKGHVICIHCAHGLKLCPKCHTFKSTKTGQWGNIIDIGMSCPKCVSTLSKCEMCGFFHETVTVEFDGRKICGKCKETYLTECNHCHKPQWLGDCAHVNDKIYCRSCLNRHFLQCSRCRNKFLKTEMKEGEPNSNGERRFYCALCYEVRHLIIHGHAYKPTWKNFGDNPTSIFFGVELEVECKDIDKTLKIVGIEKGDRIVKRDGSIRHGFEIVSYPCTLRYHQHGFNWSELCRNLKKVKCASDKTTTCGLHVHMTKLFSKIEELKFSWFMYANIEFLRTLSRRKENKYAQLPVKIWDRLTKNKEVRGERYEIVNWVNDNTVEFRLPKGTLNPDIILATVEFCDGVVHFIQRKSLIQLRKGNIQEFIGWITSNRTNRTRYAHLIKFCKKHSSIIKDPSKRVFKKIKQAPPPQPILRGTSHIMTVMDEVSEAPAASAEDD